MERSKYRKMERSKYRSMERSKNMKMDRSILRSQLCSKLKEM